MKRLLRRVRGIVGTGVTWAIGWVGLGTGIAALAGFDFSLLMRMALNNAVAGFIAGGSFALILSVAERRNRLEDLSLKRVAIWGGMGGLLLSLLPLAFGIPLAYLLGPLVINIGIGATLATGSVAIAKKGGETNFLARGRDPLLSLEGD